MTEASPDDHPGRPPNAPRVPVGSAPRPRAAMAGAVSAHTDHLPDLVAGRCVGCLACVSLCPDGAIHAVALPAIEVEGRIDAWAEDADQPRVAADTARARFVRTARFTDAPARRGALPAVLGLFVDAERSKACGACVAACASLGHGALVRIAKVADEGSGEPTLERYRRDLAFRRTLPPTPSAYRNDHVPTDLVLAEHTAGIDRGVASCPGCGAATMLRMLGIAISARGARVRGTRGGRRLCSLPARARHRGGPNVAAGSPRRAIACLPARRLRPSTRLVARGALLARRQPRAQRRLAPPA